MLVQRPIKPPLSLSARVRVGTARRIQPATRDALGRAQSVDSDRTSATLTLNPLSLLDSRRQIRSKDLRSATPILTDSFNAPTLGPGSPLPAP